MKKATMLLTAVLLLGLLAGLLCLPAAAASGTPDETVTVLFAFSDAYGASGGITYSNPDLFSAVSVSGKKKSDIFHFLCNFSASAHKNIMTLYKVMSSNYSDKKFIIIFFNRKSF